MNHRDNITEGVLLTAEDSLDGDTAAEFASFIDDMNATDNADAWITVMRIPTDARGTPLPNSKHMGQLFNEPLGSSTINDVIERIRRDYIRPGENSVTVRIIGKQAGQRGLKFNRIYTIERANDAPKAAEGREGIGELGRLMLQMQQAADERAERFERLLASQVSSRPSESVVDQLVKLAPVITAFSPVLQGLLGRAPAPASGPNEMLATVRALKEASSLFGGNDKGDGDTMSTVKAVAEAVAPGLKFLAARAETERMTASQRIARLPPPAAKIAAPKAGQTPPPAPNNPPEQTNEGEDMELKEMREKLETLAVLCDEGQDAKSVAELVVDSCDDDQLEELYAQASDPAFLSRARVLAPRAIAGREKWFEELRKAICDQYEEDPDGGEKVNGSREESPSELARDPVDLSEIPDRN